MNLIDKLYTEWAWRSKSGTPSMDNAEDKAILDSILEEIGGKEDQQNEPVPETPPNIEEDDYDAAIQKEFNGEIPEVLGLYAVPNETTTTKITNSTDKANFKRLHSIKPGGNATIGKGELALYWLYKFQNSNIGTVSDNRGGVDNPDLQLGDKFVEVKAYKGSGKTSNKIKLGGVSKEHKSIGLFKAIFGIGALTKFFNPQEKLKKVVLANNFLPDELTNACNEVFKLKDIDLSQLATEYPIFKNLESNINTVLQLTDNPESGLIMASRALGELAKVKFSSKPGIDQLIVDIDSDGNADWFKVTSAGLKKDDLYLHVTINNGILTADYKAIFG